MIEAMDRIQRFTKDLTFQGFAEHEMAQFAVMKCYEIIGEAAYHLSTNLKERHPDVEWQKIQAFRHFLVHDYYRINLAILWNTKETKLRALREELVAIRAGLDNTS